MVLIRKKPFWKQNKLCTWSIDTDVSYELFFKRERVVYIYIIHTIYSVVREQLQFLSSKQYIHKN